jgi:DNA-binding NarL/FixJ family response regulator
VSIPDDYQGHAAPRIDPIIPGLRLAPTLTSDHEVARPDLTEREVEVLIAWLHTDSKRAVARELFLATSTVHTHIERVRGKYRAVGRPATTKAALVVRALQDGIVELDDF